MADITQGGGGLPDPGGDTSNILSQLQALKRELTQGATQGRATYLSALSDIQRVISEQLVPTFIKLGATQSTEAQKAFREYQKTYRDLSKEAQQYEKAVLTSEDYKVKTIKQKLQEQEGAVKAFYKTQAQMVRDNAQLSIDEKTRAIKENQQAEREDLNKVGRNTATQAQQALKGMLVGGLSALGVGSIASMFKFDDMFMRQNVLRGTMGRIGGAPINTAGGQLTATAFAGTDTLGLSEVEKLKLLNSTLREAPKLMGQTFTPLIGVLAQFGIDADESMKMVAEANKASNVSTKQLTETVMFSAGASQQYGFDLLTTTKYTLDFTQALRQTGMGTDQAIKQAKLYSVAIQEVAKSQNLSVDDMGSIVQRLSGAISGMPVEKAAGLFTFMEGQMPRSLDQLSKVGDLKFIQNLYSRISSSAGPMGQMFGPSATASVLGIGSLTSLQAKAFKEVMDSHNFKNTEDLLDKLSRKGVSSQQYDLNVATQNLRGLHDTQSQIYALLQDWGKNVAGPLGNILRSRAILAAGAGAFGIQTAASTIGALSSLRTAAGAAGLSLELINPALAVAGLAAAGLAYAATRSSPSKDREDLHDYGAR